MYNHIIGVQHYICSAYPDIGDVTWKIGLVRLSFVGYIGLYIYTNFIRIYAIYTNFIRIYAYKTKLWTTRSFLKEAAIIQMQTTHCKRLLIKPIDAVARITCAALVAGRFAAL